MKELQRAFGLLPPRLRAHWVWLLPLMLVAAGIEAAGATAVFGLLRLLTDPAAVSRFLLTLPIPDVVEARDHKTVVVIMTLVVMALYVARLAILGAVAALKERVSFDSIVALSDRALAAYLRGPFAAVAHRPSSEMILRVEWATEVTVVLGLSSLVLLVAEVMVVTGLLIVLMVTAPITTLVAVVSTAALLLLPAAFTKTTFHRFGEREQVLGEQAQQQLRQGLGALREIRVYGREAFFRRSALEHREALAGVKRRRLVLSEVLRLMVETIFILVLLLLVIAVTWQSDGGDVVSLLGLYAYVGFRFVPSANRITLNLNNMRNAMPVARELCDDIDALDRPVETAAGPTDVTFTDDIVFDGVTYRYAADARPALSDVRLCIRRGESVGIVGTSGAGKSTLADLLLGLLVPTTGHVLVDGQDISRVRRSWQRRIGYVAQAFYLLDDSLRRNIAFGLDSNDIDDSRVAAAVRAAQLDTLIRSLPEGLETRIGEGGARLSGGERQRVAIARALYGQPDVLVFDEATAALDPQTEADLIEAMTALRGVKTMVVIAHRISTVRQCDRIVMLRSGQVHASGSFDELMAENADFRALMLSEGRDASG